MSLRDTFDGMEKAGSYVLIRNAQLDPAFNGLVDDILDEVKTLVDPIEPGMCQRIAYVFIASPGSVTPYHMDRDINFHFNVRGTKWISISGPVRFESSFRRPASSPYLPIGMPRAPRTHRNTSGGPACSSFIRATACTIDSRRLTRFGTAMKSPHPSR